YAFFEEDPATDRWVKISAVSINVSGLQTGALMLLRVISVILASQISRAGDVRAIVAGLRKLYVPETVALSIDTVLALMGQGGGGGGGVVGGGGGGGGRRREGEALGEEGFWASLRRMARGDVGALVHRLERQIDRA